jgi:hypothetical protein
MWRWELCGWCSGGTLCMRRCELDGWCAGVEELGRGVNFKRNTSILNRPSLIEIHSSLPREQTEWRCMVNWKGGFHRTMNRRARCFFVLGVAIYSVDRIIFSALCSRFRQECNNSHWQLGVAADQTLSRAFDFEAKEDIAHWINAKVWLHVAREVLTAEATENSVSWNV